MGLLDTLLGAEEDEEDVDVDVPGAPPELSFGAELRLGLDSAFELLSSQRRRRVLLLLDASEQRTKAELAEAIAGLEGGPEEDEPDDAAYRRVWTALHQNHLEDLANAHAIEPVDGDDDAYAPGENHAALVELIEHARMCRLKHGR